MMDLSQLPETCFPLLKIPQLRVCIVASITADKFQTTKIPNTQKQSTDSSILLNTFWHANATFPTHFSLLAAHTRNLAHSTITKKPSFKPSKMSIFLWYSPLTHFKFQPLSTTCHAPPQRRSGHLRAPTGNETKLQTKCSQLLKFGSTSCWS
jgi:hypothetical protein